MVYQFDDRSAPRSEELEHLIKLRKDNLRILQDELTDKNVLIKSNVYFDRKERTYLVKEVKEESIKTRGKLIPGIRLVNEEVILEEQPLLKYPTSLIEKVKEGEKNKLVLIYTSELNIDRDFRQLHRETKSDLEIYVYY
ncbi:MAG: hypothetical protein ABIF11_04985 [Nitrospirota bacterium]